MSSDQRSSHRRLIKNTSWLSAGRLATDISNLILFIVLSRNFGVTGIGQYAYAFAIAGVAGSIMHLGLEDYAIRELSRMDSRTGRIRLMEKLLATQLYVTVITALATALYLLLTGAETTVIHLVIILSVYMYGLMFSRTMLAPAFSRQVMAGPAIAEFLCNALPIAASVVMILVVRTGLEYALIPLATGMLALAVYAMHSTRQHLGRVIPSATPVEAVKVLVSTWQFSASVIVFYLSSRIGLIILTLMTGNLVAGLYATGLKILDVSTRPLHFLGIASYPLLSQTYSNQPGEFPALADRLLKLSLLTGFLLTWSIAFIAPLLLAPVFGAEFNDARPVVQAMSVIAVLIAIDQASFRLLFAMHLQTKRIRIHFTGMLLSAAGSLLLIPQFGVYGSICASIASYLLMSMMYFRILRNRTPTRTLSTTLGSFIMAAAVSAAAGSAVFYSLQGIAMVAFTMLAIFIVAGVPMKLFSLAHKPEAG